jgi:hypothetical protein
MDLPLTPARTTAISLVYRRPSGNTLCRRCIAER